MTIRPGLTDDVDRARQHSLGELLHRSAQRYPDKLAIVDGHARFTFSEFDDVVNQIARSLAVRGLAQGQRLALLSRNCWQFGALAFATARLGVVLVPINFALTATEIGYILTDAEVAAMVVQDEFVPTAVAALGEAGLALSVRAVVGEGGQPAGWEPFAEWATGSAEPVVVSVADDDAVRLMYTSGTESRPKGVIATSRALIAQYVSCIVDGGMTADDVEVHALPMYHCAQLDCFFVVDVYLGATSVILPAPTPSAVLAAIEEFRATKFFAPPTVWIGLLAAPEFAATDLSSLAKGYYGASPMPTEVLKELRQRLPEVRLWNFYGQTELSPMATILRPEEQLAHAGSAGRAALNVETIVVNDDGNPVPTGQIGEIVHRTPHACLGYHKQPDKTAEMFRGGWLHSGDLGVIDAEGYLTVVDRKKDMIKTGGENVASREVEEALYEIPGVVEVAVFGIPHRRWIEAVTAAIVVKPGHGVDRGDVDRQLAGRLAGYKRPKFVVFVGQLPKNPSGKILKRQLRDTYAQLSDEPGSER